MRRLFIIIITLLLAGGAIAGLMLLEIIPNPFAGTEEEMANGEGAGASGSSGFVPPEEEAVLLILEDLIIPVIINGRVIKRIYITARLAVDPLNERTVQNGLYRLENELNEKLIAYFQRHFSNNRRLDPPGIKRVMAKAAKDVYGELIIDIFLRNVFEQ